MLGEHVAQAGSAVRPDKLRFDFTHEKALSPEEREQVEELVNEQIFVSRPVRTFETPIDEARKLGAQMLFGEKYGDIVRVVEIDGFSRELCGGTHVRSTAEIGPFVILSEGSVGSGARRIEAVTSGEAFALLHERAREGDELRAQLAAARKETKTKGGKAEADYTVTRETAAGDVTVLVVELTSGDPLDVSDRLKQQHAPAAVIVGALNDGTAQLADQPRQVTRGPWRQRGRRDSRGGGADRREGRRPADDGACRRQAAGAPRGRGRAGREDDYRGAGLDEGPGPRLRRRADRRRGLRRNRNAGAAAHRGRACRERSRPAGVGRARGGGEVPSESSSGCR